MASLSQAKALGAVGSILVILGIIPAAGGVLAIVGFVLTLIAIKDISDVVKDQSIFNNMIVAVLLAIGGIVAGTLFVLGAMFRFFGLRWMMGPTFFNPTNVQTGDAIAFGLSILGGLAALWVFFVVSAIFLRRSYNSIGAKLNVKSFQTAGCFSLSELRRLWSSLGLFSSSWPKY
jgi:uncharacterized membrane protein